MTISFAFGTCWSMRARQSQWWPERSARTCEPRGCWSWRLFELIEIIGEAAARVSLEGQLEYSSIRWRQVVGMRNRLAHGYDKVDQARVMHEPPVATADLAVLPGVLGSRTLRRTDEYASGPSPCGCPVAQPSPRSRDGVSCITRARCAVGHH